MIVNVCNNDLSKIDKDIQIYGNKTTDRHKGHNLHKCSYIKAKVKLTLYMTLLIVKYIKSVCKVLHGSSRIGKKVARCARTPLLNDLPFLCIRKIWRFLNYYTVSEKTLGQFQVSTVIPMS